MIYYAHSPNNGIPAQTYDSHIVAICQRAVDNTKDIIFKDYMIHAVFLAALFHDIGKLHPASQKVLSGEEQADHILNHVDAGTCYCISQYKKTNHVSWLIATLLVHSHHRGFHDFYDFFKITKKLSFGSVNENYNFIDDAIRDLNIKEITDRELEMYINISNSLMPDLHTKAHMLCNNGRIPSPTDFRMMLSCFVDADHGDTSEHYGSPRKTFSIQLNPNKQLEKLNSFLNSIQSNGSYERQIGRSMLLSATRNIGVSKFHNIDAPVGTGKTFSTLVGALTLADKKNAKRIFTILPFTNVISQTVSEYRKALNQSEWFVAEIHSKVEFNNFLLRKFNNLWDAPINVATAVQFFETLWSNHPSTLRKFKQFANSIIIIDEFHTAIPVNYWKAVLEIMRELSDKYNTTFIFASGTSTRFWRIFDDIPIVVDEVLPENTYNSLQLAEINRVNKKHIGNLTLDELLIHIDRTKSTLLVFNTVKNAKIFAEAIPESYYISSHLTPEHREKVLSEIKIKLYNNEKIIVIATSILECGHDISFDCGYREMCGINSIMQCAGRINRGGHIKDAFLYIMTLNGDWTHNPQIHQSTKIASTYNMETLSPEDCTDAISNEIDMVLANEYYQFEKKRSMKKLGELRVINNPTTTIICDWHIVMKIKNGDFVSPQELTRKSIQVWENNLNRLMDKLIPLDNGTYGLNDGVYDARYGVVP